jgi:hypothetical protein
VAPATVRAPILAISALDDGFGACAGAEYTATQWPTGNGRLS